MSDTQNPTGANDADAVPLADEALESVAGGCFLDPAVGDPTSPIVRFPIDDGEVRITVVDPGTVFDPTGSGW
jgi:hypothetical protein